MEKTKIITLLSISISAMISGLVVGALPDPIDANTLAMLNSNPQYQIVDETGFSWLSLAEKTNDSYEHTKNTMKLFLIVLAPFVTIIPIIRSRD